MGAAIVSARTAFFSSGTHGKPKVIFMGDHDLERIIGTCRDFCQIEGLEPGERAMLILPMNLWSVGRITMLGMERAGLQVLPVNTQTPKDLWSIAATSFTPRVMSSTPSVFEELGKLDMDLPPQRILETTGEPLSPYTRSRIENRFGGKTRDAYGLTECIVGTECCAQDGYHFVQGSVRLEIVNLVNGRPVGPGAMGEIVVTSLMQEIMPMIRFRTGDLGLIDERPCRCGYPSPRLKVLGRIRETLFLPAGVQITNTEIHEVMAPYLDRLIPRPCLRAHFPRGGPIRLDLLVPTQDSSLLGSAEADTIEDSLRDRLRRASLDIKDLVDLGDIVVEEVRIIEPSCDDLAYHRKPFLRIEEIR